MARGEALLVHSAYRMAQLNFPVWRRFAHVSKTGSWDAANPHALF